MPRGFALYTCIHQCTPQSEKEKASETAVRAWVRATLQRNCLIIKFSDEDSLHCSLDTSLAEKLLTDTFVDFPLLAGKI